MPTSIFRANLDGPASSFPRWRFRSGRHPLTWFAFLSALVLLRVSPAAAQSALPMEWDGKAASENLAPQTPPHADDPEDATDPNPGPVLELEAHSSVQTLWARDKVIVGGTLRLGRRLYFGAIETHLIWTTDRPDAVDRPFLGSQYGLYFELMPLRSNIVELSTAVGADIFHLWGIHGDEVEASLSFKAQLHVHVTKRLATTLGARVYPVSSTGVALGEGRDGRSSMPVLLSSGVEWTW